MHHVCYEVDDIYAARDQMQAERCDHHRHGRAAHRRARQARDLPAPQRFCAVRWSSSNRPEPCAISYCLARSSLRFLALFCLLPIGLREDAEPTVKLTTKFLLATVIAVVGWGIFYAMIRTGVVDI